MAYPIRCFDSAHTYFVSSRTLHGRLFMKPDRLVNELIGAVLARSVRKFRICLYDFVFASNHFHLIAKANSPEDFCSFMQYLQSNIAVKVGRLINWRGKFWARRYSAEPILDDAAFLERVRYIKAHGVKERHVSLAENWPGLTSFAELCEGKRRIFPWRSWTKLWGERRRGQREAIGRAERYSLESQTETEALVLTPFPCWSHLTPEERRTEMRSLVADTNKQHAWTTSSDRKRIQRIINQNPSDKPCRSGHTKRPRCHASSKAQWQAYCSAIRELLVAYRGAATKWLAGNLLVEFPPGCLRPPAWRVAIASA